MSAGPSRDPDEAAASALGRLLHAAGEASAGAPANSELARLLRRAKAEPERGGPVTRRARRWSLAGVLVAAAVLALRIGWDEREASLTFSANGVPGHDGVAVAGSGHAVALTFSDGSVFDVEPAARLRVDTSSAVGARLTLVNGRTVARVVHRSSSHWSVSAGPFVVQVTGTRFGAAWNAKSERLSVELYEGSVQVTGGALSAPISVSAGQRLEAGTRPGEWLLTSLDGAAKGVSARAVSSTASSTANTAASEQPSESAPSDPAPASRKSSPSFGWAALLGRADFEGIVREASDFGVERCFSTCSSSDLRMLADSARYLGRYTLAEQSLLTLRKRSPSDAASAAFLLGRLEESRGSPKAAYWYDENLDEAPSGAYAAEALAGKMRVLLKSGGVPAAAPVARQYLQRFPSGIYAEKAREILSPAKAPGERRAPRPQ